MKDINFSDYKKHNSKYDTGKIPITQSEREIIERRNQKRYEQIIKNQQPTETSSGTHYENNIHSKQRNTVINKKKGCGCSTLLISILLIFAILCGTIFGYVFSLCSKTQYEPTNNELSLDLTNIQNNIYNVLLIGVDEEDNGQSRSDTMILVTIDKSNKQIKLTSFMRDLWVKIPGYDEARLNAAFANGGSSLLMETISDNFDIHIDNYVLVNFEMFEKLIDGIGGVTVDITEKEAEFINRTTHAKVTAGSNTLNGDYALIYCRIRKLDSDFMRTQRQRKVMTALFDKITSQNLLISVKAASDILPLITTDISALKMTFKLFTGIGMIDYSTEQIRIPTDGTYANKTINGQAVLVPDLDSNIEIIHNFIY